MRALTGLKAISVATLLGASTLGWTIPMTTVGGVDALIGSSDLGNSGKAVEEAWVESVLGYDVVFDDKMDGGFNWALVQGTSRTYAQALSDSPDYFLVKTGHLKGTGDTHFLFQNVAELAYAVINLAEMGFNLKDGVGKISHISLFEQPTTTPVSEPAILSLLGLGLLGLGWVRRMAS